MGGRGGGRVIREDIINRRTIRGRRKEKKKREEDKEKEKKKR